MEILSWGVDAPPRLWEYGATALRAQLARSTWGPWFQDVRAVELDRGRPHPRRPELLAADRIRSSYTGMLTDTLRDVTGQQLRVELTVETEPDPSRRSRASRRLRHRP